MALRPSAPVLYVGTPQAKGWRVVRCDDGMDLHLAPNGEGYRVLRQTEGNSKVGASQPDLILDFSKCRTLLPPLTERKVWLRKLGPRQLAKRVG